VITPVREEKQPIAMPARVIGNLSFADKILASANAFLEH
jgi:hypothetical protein